VSYSPPPPPTLARPPRTGRGLLAIRVLRPPIELEVLVTPLITNHQSPITNPPCHPERSEGSAPVPPAHRTPHTEHRTIHLLSLKAASPGATPPICGSVKVASGPWSLEEGWWKGLRSQREESPGGEEPRAAGARAREGSGTRLSPHPGEPPAGASADPQQANATFRDYWDVELSDGALYRIYRDRKTNAWFADGIYD
jgi:hypothetical protein